MMSEQAQKIVGLALQEDGTVTIRNELVTVSGLSKVTKVTTKFFSTGDAEDFMERVLFFYPEIPYAVPKSNTFLFTFDYIWRQSCIFSLLDRQGGTL